MATLRRRPAEGSVARLRTEEVGVFKVGGDESEFRV